MLLRLNTQSVFERMIPQFFHQIPIFNETILDRIFDLHVILSIFECRCANAVANIAACCCTCRGAAGAIHVHLFTCARRPLSHDTILSRPHHPNRLPPKQKPLSASRGHKRARGNQTQKHQKKLGSRAGAWWLASGIGGDRGEDGFGAVLSSKARLAAAVAHIDHNRRDLICRPPPPRRVGKSRLALQRSQSRRAPLRHQESKSACMLVGFFWCCAVRCSLPFASHVRVFSTHTCNRVALRRAHALVPVRAANAQSKPRVRRHAAQCGTRAAAATARAEDGLAR